MLTLDADQERAVERMVNEPTRAALNASQYGTGKTVVTVEVGKRLGGAINLVACPIFTKLGWEKTIKAQIPGAKVFMIDSTKKGKENFLRLKAGKAGWYIIGRELMVSKNYVESIVKIAPRIDFLVYDECAKFANRKSKTFAAMKRIKPKYKMALSATPYANKFENMFAITRWLWPNLYTSFWSWASIWCATEYDPFTYNKTKVVGEKEEGKYVTTLPCYIYLTIDFGPTIDNEVIVRLNSHERKQYDNFKRTMIAWLGEHPMIAELPVVQRLRLRQMTLGSLEYDAEANVVTFDASVRSTKYKALVAILKDAGKEEPAIIFTHSRHYAQVVVHQLTQDGFKAAEWSGDISEKQREEHKQMFLRGDIDYIVATVGSIGEGVDELQHRARLMIWLSRDDNNMLNMQAYRRLYRRGQKKQVVSIDIVAEDTYDRGQLDHLTERALSVNRILKGSTK